jgi:hypothetical protein
VPGKRLLLSRCGIQREPEGRVPHRLWNLPAGRDNSSGEGTFLATVALDGPQGPAEVDARPSDALNLALAVGVPVRVDRDVLERAAAEVDRVDVELPPLPGPGGEGAPGARAIVEELASG